MQHTVAATVASAQALFVRAAHILLGFVAAAVEAAVEDPLVHVYMHGPAWNGWGFWEGQANEDICSAISHVPASFWATHSTDCAALVQRHQHAFVVGFEFVSAVLLAVLVVFWLLIHLTVVRPVTRALLPHASAASAV